MTLKPVRRMLANHQWEAVTPLHYKEEGSAPFKDVSRHVLFGDTHIDAELRYFEVSAGGYTTLERHEHAHAVLILRGAGRVLIGDEVHEVACNDLVSIAPMTWHQFRPADGEVLGFLCMVNQSRDRPQLPNSSELERLRATPAIGEFIRV